MMDDTPHQNDNETRAIIASSQEQITQALIVRAASFLRDDKFTTSEIFDGNDACATHLLMLAGAEPIGSARLRFFNGFVKAERTAFRIQYRNVRYLRTFIHFMFDHCAQKGYPVLLTYAEDTYARLWMKLFGFEAVEGRPVMDIAGKERIVELVKHLPRHPDAVSLGSDPAIQFRQEGSWTAPSQFERP